MHKVLPVLLILLIVIGCNCNTKNNNKLRIGYVPLSVALPLFVAADEGYFKEQGFDVEMIRFTSSNEVSDAATADRIDVFVAATNVIFDIGYVSKKKHKLIIPNTYSNQLGHITDFIVVKDTNTIKRIEDLKGKKIAIFPGSVIKVFCNLILQKHGIEKADYQLIEMSPKDWPAALQSGQVDVVSALEPQATQMIRDKIGYPIVKGFYAQLMPNVPLSAHWISDDFVKKHGDEKANKIVIAIDKAIDFIDNNPIKAKEYLVKYANVRRDILDDVELNPWKKHSQISPTEIQNFMNLLYDNGAIQNKENINDYLLK